MSNIEKIKAEIKKQADNYQDTYTDCMRDNLLSFIESREKEQSSKIKGWVARDKNGKLNFFLGKPRKIINTQGQEYWIGHCRMKQPNEFFPDLRWEDDPIEVELTINRV